MNAFKCDRCGAYYDQQPHAPQFRDRGRTLSVKFAISQDDADGRDPYQPDLCTTCTISIVGVAVSRLTDGVQEVQP